MLKPANIVHNNLLFVYWFLILDAFMLSGGYFFVYAKISSFFATREIVSVVISIYNVHVFMIFSKALRKGSSFMLVCASRNRTVNRGSRVDEKVCADMQNANYDCNWQNENTADNNCTFCTPHIVLPA